jgi:hypothetical protein
MLTATFDTTQFEKQMKNILGYSFGFLDGVEDGKTIFAERLAAMAIDDLKQFIDSNARVNPQALHHVYEWSKVGSPDARLFDIDYVVSNGGLTISSTFRQSLSVKEGSREPFYNKAKIMESGIPVVIKPKNAKKLAFEVDGKTVFTDGPITVSNPGGDASGQYQKTFDLFFSSYFSQSFLRNSGIIEYIQNAKDFESKFSQAPRGGRSLGVATGYKWIAGAGVR